MMTQVYILVARAAADSFLCVCAPLTDCCTMQRAVCGPPRGHCLPRAQAETDRRTWLRGETHANPSHYCLCLEGLEFCVSSICYLPATPKFLSLMSLPPQSFATVRLLLLQAVTIGLGAWLVSTDASSLQRAWITPSLVFSLGFIDSSIQGLCTESWVSVHGSQYCNAGVALSSDSLDGVHA